MVKGAVVGRIVEYRDLSDIQRDALEAAIRVLENSYNPYSGFSVGATLISTEGELITGTNFECAAYGSTICAERAAILRANSKGIRNVTGLALIARDKGSDIDDIISPCGSCRQLLFELAQVSGNDIEIVLSSTNKEKIRVTSIAELLPLGFGPDDLDKIDLSPYRTWRVPK
jgi:cytidine deaminase